MAIEDSRSNIRAKSPFIIVLIRATLSAVLNDFFKNSLEIRTMLSYNTRLKGDCVMLVVTKLLCKYNAVLADEA